MSNFQCASTIVTASSDSPACSSALTRAHGNEPPWTFSRRRDRVGHHFAVVEFLAFLGRCDGESGLVAVVIVVIVVFAGVEGEQGNEGGYGEQIDEFIFHCCGWLQCDE